MNIDLKFLRIGFKTRVGYVQLTFVNVFLLNGSADKEIWGDVVSFCQLVPVTEPLDNFLLVNTPPPLLLLEYVQAILNNIFRIGKLLMNRFPDNIVIVLVILAVSDEKYFILRRL